MRHVLLLLCPLVAMLISPLAEVARAGDDSEQPILLTNEDVERLSPKPTTSGRAKAPPPGPAAPLRPDVPRHDEVRRGRATRADPDQLPERTALRSPASSWQEEYYRLKALALERALKRGDAVDFSDPPAPAETPADQKSTAQPSSPACLYDADGALIHAPRGRDCRPNRRERDGAPSSRSKTEGGSCAYGLRGEVLYRPPGRSCAR